MHTGVKNIHLDFVASASTVYNRDAFAAACSLSFKIFKLNLINALKC